MGGSLYLPICCGRKNMFFKHNCPIDVFGCVGMAITMLQYRAKSVQIMCEIRIVSWHRHYGTQISGELRDIHSECASNMFLLLSDRSPLATCPVLCVFVTQPLSGPIQNLP